MAELTDAQKRKLIKELRGASKLHAGQADKIERTLTKKKKKQWIKLTKRYKKLTLTKESVRSVMKGLKKDQLTVHGDLTAQSVCSGE